MVNESETAKKFIRKSTISGSQSHVHYCLLSTHYCPFTTACCQLLLLLVILTTANCPPLPTTYCLPPTANYLLPTAYCLPPTACRLLPTAHCLLPTAYCLPPTAYCQLPTANCQLHHCQLHHCLTAQASPSAPPIAICPLTVRVFRSIMAM